MLVVPGQEFLFTEAAVVLATIRAARQHMCQVPNRQNAADMQAPTLTPLERLDIR